MKMLVDLFFELLTMLTCPLVGFLALFVEKEQFSAYKDLKKSPIIIVERWFNKNPFHVFRIMYLQKRGFHVIALNFPLHKGTFRESAQQLKKYMDTNDLHDVVLVGISGGGLTSFLYVQEMNGWERVKHVICVASPFRGTPLAYLMPFFPSTRELLPSSRFVKDFQNMTVRIPEKILLLVGKFDQFVPTSRTVLPGAKRRVIDVYGHNNLHVLSNDIYEIAARFSQSS